MHPGKIFAPARNWKDPVATDHMRTDSDVVIFISGKLLAEQKDFTLFVSGDTGDFVTPDVVLQDCLVSARRRLDGFVELQAGHVLEKSMLHKHPPEYFAATGELCDEELLPSMWRAKRRRSNTPPQKARGSAEPPPRDKSSRGSGAASPLRLTEAPWHYTFKKKLSPPPSPRGSRNWASKTQDGAVSGSTREAEIPDYDPDSLAEDNKRSRALRPPIDEPTMLGMPHSGTRSTKVRGPTCYGPQRR
jgi:hypothetical protein